MLEKLARIFAEDGFMPHGHCFLWSRGLTIVHAASDTLIGLAYIAIAGILYYLVRKNRLPFGAVIFSFGVFIGACGLTHFMEVLTIWVPAYWFSGGVKVVTAVASVVSGVWLYPVSKRVTQIMQDARLVAVQQQQLKVRTAELEEANTRLQAEIRERRKVEEMLRDTQEDLATAQRVGQVGSWSCDAVLRHFEWSEEACRLLDLDPCFPAPRFDRFLQLVHTDDRDRVETAFYDTVKWGAPLIVEYGVIHSDGSELKLKTQAHLTLGEKGRPQRMVGIVQNITAWKKAEAQSRFLLLTSDVLNEPLSLELRLQGLAKLIVGQLADWCVIDVIDRRGQIHRAALGHRDPYKAEIARELREASLDQSNPQHWIGAVMRSGKSRLVSKINWEQFKQGMAMPRNLQLIEQLGIVSYMVVPLQARGRTVGVLVLVSNARSYRSDDLLFAEVIGRRTAVIVENAQLFEETQEAIRSRDEFIGIISHELRNPLSELALNIELIRRILAGQLNFPEERIVGMLKRMEDGVTQANRLVSDLLDFTRIEAGRLRIEAKPVAVREFLQRVTDWAQPQARSRRLTLVVKPVDATWTVYCDPSRTFQIISNLIGNAFKFTSEGGEVRIAVARDPSGDFLLKVQDTGMGILPQDLPHIFERYWQARETAKMGSGLGLSISKGLVEAQGGRIWVESEPGKGTTFFFTLKNAHAVSEEKAAG